MALEAFFERIATLPIVLTMIVVYAGSTIALAYLNPKDKIQDSLKTSKVTYFAAGRTFGYDPQKLYAMLNAFNKQPDGDKLKKEYRGFFYYDFIYPLLYAVSLAVIIAYLQKRWNIPEAAGEIEPMKMHYLWALPLLAMVFDYLENLSLLFVLKNYEGAPMPFVVGFSRWMTMLKLLLVYASLFLFICLILIWLGDAWKALFKSKSVNQSA